MEVRVTYLNIDLFIYIFFNFNFNNYKNYVILNNINVALKFKIIT